MQRVPSKHLNGAIYLKLPGKEELNFNDYFLCIQHSLSLFEEMDFKGSVAGFYINYIADPNAGVPKGGMRIVYFSTDNRKTIAVIDAFVKKNTDKIKLFHSSGAYQEKITTLTEIDAKRLSFWNNLNDSTHIALDLLVKLGVVDTHAVMYHYGTICLPQGVMPKDFLEPFYKRHSPYYQALEKEGLAERYWKDLTTWFDADLPLHFPCNMLLGPNEHAFKHLLGTIATRRS